MKILITGASGFIGSRLAVKAIERGHSVLALGQTNNEWEQSRLARLEAAGVRTVNGSILDPALMTELCTESDVVIHLAAAQHESNVSDDYFREINVAGTRVLLGAAIDCGIRRFVHGSTIGVYGSASNGELSEDSATAPDNIYGVTKLEGEALVRQNAARIPVTIARISETYGPGDLRLLKLFKAIDSGRFLMIGNGLNERQLIYVDDLADALLTMADTDAAVGEIFVLAGHEVMTTRTMVASIAAVLGKKASRLRLPFWPFSVLATVLESTLPRVGISPPIHQRRLDFFRKSFFFSPEKVKTLLAFQPAVNFEEGAARTVAWYRDEGLLGASVDQVD